MRYDDDDGNDHADDAGEEGEGKAFQQELCEDVAGAGSEGFEQADLAGALSDGDEHDVHDAYAAYAEGHGSDDSEEEVERGAELHDVLPSPRRCPNWGRLCRLWDRSGGGSARTARTAWMALMWSSGAVGWKTMQSGSRWSRSRRMVSKGTKAFSVSGPLLEESWILLSEDADDLEDVAFDFDGLADGWVAVEELLRGVGAEDDDLAMVGEVGGLEVTALVDVESSHASVGEVDGFALRC